MVNFDEVISAPFYGIHTVSSDILPDVNLTPKAQDLKAPTLVSPNSYFHTKWGNVSKALKHHPNSSFEDPTSFTTLAEC